MLKAQFFGVAYICRMKGSVRFALLVAISIAQMDTWASDVRTYSLLITSETQAGFGALLPQDKANSSMTRYTAAFRGRITYDFRSSRREALVSLEPDALDLS